MQITEQIQQTSASLLIERATLWDNSSKDEQNNAEKCVAPLNDNAWQSINTLKDLIDQKYGFSLSAVSSSSGSNERTNAKSLSPWTNADLDQV